MVATGVPRTKRSTRASWHLLPTNCARSNREERLTWGGSSSSSASYRYLSYLREMIHDPSGTNRIKSHSFIWPGIYVDGTVWYGMCVCVCVHAMTRNAHSNSVFLFVQIGYALYPRMALNSHFFLGLPNALITCWFLWHIANVAC